MAVLERHDYETKQLTPRHRFRQAEPSCAAVSRGSLAEEGLGVGG